jgi:GNAT superfamily N-acetyltransferase
LRLMNLGDFRRKKTAAYYSWFYFGGPRDTVLVQGFDPHGRLAGQMGLQFRELSDIRAGMIVDMVVAPEFRGQGTFREMEAEAARFALARGASALTSFTNAMGEKALLRLGSWSLGARITTLEWTGRVPEPPSPVGAGYSPRWLSFSRLDTDDDWRFRRHPEYTYRHWTEGTGAMWTKDFTDPATGLTFTDLVSVGGAEPTPPELLSTAVQALRDGGASVLTAWAMAGVPDAATLTKLGFRPGDQQRSLCVRWLTREAESKFQGVNWALRQADTEVF